MALDITTDTAQVAIVPTGTIPGDADWITGTWVRSAPNSVVTKQNPLTTEYRFVKIAGTTADGTDTAYIRFLLGPAGDAQLPQTGTVDVWVRVTDNPENVAINVGKIQVT